MGLELEFRRVLFRSCTVQRRHQKIIEAAPAVGLAEETRQALYDSALRLADHAGYLNAGTVEFLFDVDTGEFYFIEVNPRIQVEHPVTEMITGEDLVGLQLRLARGDDLADMTQDGIEANGHAIE